MGQVISTGAVVQKTLYHFTQDDLAKMTAGDLADLIERVKRDHPNAEFHGTAEVRRADGTVKHDAPQEA